MATETRALATINIASELEPEVQAVASKLAPLFPKDMTEGQTLAVARVAVAYGLDPFLGELIPYQGKPYITYDGRVRLADRHPAYDGFECDPATPDEIKALKAHADQVVFRCTVHRRDRRKPIIAFGRAGGPGENNPVAKQWTAEVAYKRAVHRAMRAAFPVPIPGLEESVSSEQLRALHAYDADLGVSREARHQELGERFGVATSAELTSDQASSYIDTRVIELDADGRAIDRATGEILPEDSTEDAGDLNAQLARDLASCKQWAVDAQDASQLKDAWRRTVALGLEGDGEVIGAFTQRRQELAAARAANGGGR
jgi:hypothetical protein